MNGIVFNDEEHGIKLRVGNEVSFKYIGDVDGRHGFYNSEIGKMMKKGTCDEAVLTVKQREWLEVYFECRMKKDGKFLTNDDFYGKDPDDKEDNEIYSEICDYMFLRYMINNVNTSTDLGQ